MATSANQGRAELGHPRWVAELQGESAAFIARRLRRNAETVEEISTATSLSDLLAIQSRWMSTALQDYASQGAKLSALAAQASAAPGSLADMLTVNVTAEGTPGAGAE